jgi:UDP-N-acetylmuramate dehydrogenase
MNPRENVPLATLTTLRVGGPAQVVLSCDSVESLTAAHAQLRERGLSYYPLGQGSNVLAGDAPIQKGILLMRIEGIEFVKADSFVDVLAGAGVSWDTLVHACAERTLWGLENLAGIPGTVGAAPVQNIGAYGAEVADTLLWVEAYDANTDTLARIDANDCSFSYRDSRFKREPNLIITRVAFRLARTSSPKLDYADIVRAQEAGALLRTPQEIGDAVRAIRSKKFPNLRTHGTAGSFFKNPTITSEAYDALLTRYPGIPGYINASGIKVSLAWILDHVLSMRGFRLGHASLFETQPLVLVTEDGATAHDVDALAKEVQTRVHDATNIFIEREVRTLA